mgnify:CR=1 FL=1
MPKRSESVFDGRLVSEGYRRRTRTVIFQALGIFSGTVALARCRKPSGTAKVRPQVLSVGGRILELLLELAGPCDKVYGGRLYTVDAIRYQPKIPEFPRQME